MLNDPVKRRARVLDDLLADIHLTLNIFFLEAKLIEQSALRLPPLLLLIQPCRNL